MKILYFHACVFIFHGIVENPGHVLEFSTQLLYFPNTDFVFSKYDQRILCVKMVGTTGSVEPILQMNVQFCRNEIVAEQEKLYFN